VDGISGVDIVSVLFDSSPEPRRAARPGWALAAPSLPSLAQLFAEALLERATMPAEIGRSVAAVLRAPGRVAEPALDAAAGVGAMAWAGLKPAPPVPYNAPIGPHLRYTWVRADLGDFTAIKDELGGTVNDVIQQPIARLEVVREELRHLKEGGQAVGARVLVELAGFAPTTILDQAARLSARQRFFNLVVRTSPARSFPSTSWAASSSTPSRWVPLARNQGLGMAIMSYNGRMNLGLVGDYDLRWDIDDLAEDVAESLAELAGAAGVELASPPRARGPEPVAH
jgi:diacylglycerol O-acyltransferase / wax synthase